MDVDCPNALKRCASVPSINQNLLQANTITKMNMTSTTQQQTAAALTAANVDRENAPSPVFNILAPRARRYSASFSGGGAVGGGLAGPRLTPRVSQLRFEESADISNSREVKHEREVHSAMQMSQSWEDLTLVTENLSCKSDEFMVNPLQVCLPIGPPVCSSPSPTRYV